MINIEYQVFSLVYDAVQAYDPTIYVTSEISSAPPSFPAVCVTETGNSIPDQFRISSRAETYAEIRAQVDIYSNTQSGPKAQAKAIFSAIDDALRVAGLRLTKSGYSYLPEANSFNKTVVILTAQYECTADTGGNIYATR